MRQTKYEYDRHYHLEEILTIALLSILNGLILFFAHFNRTSASIFSLNLLVISFIAVLPLIYRFKENKYLLIFRDIYIILVGGFIFFEHHYLVPMVNPHDIDQLLIRWDRMLFLGHDPTKLLEAFTIPALTELLQLSYISYYLLPLSLCLCLYLTGKKLSFHIVTTTLLFGLYVCYLGYYLGPAIGPRFTLAQYQSFPLSGILFFDHISKLITTFEGVTRDCFPSGHTLVSLLTALMAYKYHKSFFKISTLWAALIVISTVYLRYHYVVDLIAAIVLALFVYRYHSSMVLKFIYYLDRSEEKLVLQEVKSSI